MKTKFTFILVLFATILFSSCKKDDAVIPAPIADFISFPIANLRAPIEITFTNSSQNATSYVWDFGGGAPPSTEKSPKVTFTTAGIFTVTLKAVGDGGANTKTQTITILPPLTPQDRVVGRYQLTALRPFFGGSALTPCLADNTIEFTANGQYITNNLGIMCSSSEPAIRTDTYFLSSTGTIMTLGSGSNAIIFDSVQITSTQLILNTNTSGTSFQGEMIFTRI